MLFIVCKIRNPVSFYLCSVHNNYGCDSLPALRILNYNMIICVSEMSRHLSPFPFFRKTWGNFQPVISAFYPHNAFIQSLHAPCRGSGCPGPVRFAVIFRMCGIAVCKYIWLGTGLRGRILFTVRHDFFQSTKCFSALPSLQSIRILNPVAWQYTPPFSNSPGSIPDIRPTFGEYFSYGGIFRGKPKSCSILSTAARSFGSFSSSATSPRTAQVWRSDRFYCLHLFWNQCFPSY